MFGSAVMFRIVGKAPGGVMTERWRFGTWLGKRFHTEEHFVAQQRGWFSDPIAGGEGDVREDHRGGFGHDQGCSVGPIGSPARCLAAENENLTGNCHEVGVHARMREMQGVVEQQTFFYPSQPRSQEQDRPCVQRSSRARRPADDGILCKGGGAQ